MKKAKRLISVLLSVVMLFSITAGVDLSAYADTSGDGDYEYTMLEDGTAEITGYLGSGGNITIPSEIDGYTITSIGDWAFDSCTSLSNISIPDSVTNIGNWAFYNCTSLTNITIPDSVTSIGDGAFSNCTSLTNITIPDSVTSIGRSTFASCSNLTSVEIPNSVTRIGVYVFCNCTSLINITIPNSVTSIGDSAFGNCASLTNITIPDSVSSIGNMTFYDCTSLTNIIVDENNTVYDSRNNCNAIIETETNTLIQGCKNTTIPDGVTSIGDFSFGGCTSLTNITIPDSVTSIGDSAFDNCASLTNITIPDSVTYIGSSAFYGCTIITSIIVDENNTVYDSRNDCNAVIETETNTLIQGCKNTTIPDSITNIGKNAFGGCEALTGITIPSSVTSIGDFAFGSCTSLTNITIPNSVTSIGDYAFCNCASLTNFTIPNRVTSIDDFAFGGCTSLTNITIPDSITSIGDYAFDNCASLTNITIPDSVSSIGNWAFDNCAGLTNITIPNSVTSIGYYAFYGCTSLTDVYYTGSEEQWNDIIIGYENDSLQNATIHFNYTPECSHVYEVISVVPATVDTNEVIMYQCSLCGNQYVEESSLNLADFKIKTVSLSLTSSITMNFKVLKTAVADFENPYVQFTRNGNTVTVSEYTEQGDYLVFSYNDIAPQAMNDTVTAILKATHNTIEYSSSPLEYSVSKYAYTMLDKCSGDQYAKLRTLIVDLLNYGAEAQSYQNYKTDDLVNSKLNDTQKAWASTDELALADVTDKNYATVENALVEWKSASLQLNNSVAVRYKFTAQNVDNLSVKVNCGASQWEYGADSFTDNGDGTYYFLFNDLNADKMSEDIFITVMNGDTAVSNTMRFSVESYSKKVQDLMPNSSLQKLTDAMMRYGKSAANYA